MGGAKNDMMEYEENRQLAAVYLVERGALEQCDVHHDIYGGGMDLDGDFWRGAMIDKNRGNRGPVAWAADLGAREYTDLIKAAYDEHVGDECGHCAKHLYRD